MICSKEDSLLKQKIQAFFLRDDVSRASAGKKETVTKKQNKIQKRYMLDTMINLHKKYVIDEGVQIA